MSRRLKLIIAYDGAPFAGWQSQSHRNTVQDHLERALDASLAKRCASRRGTNGRRCSRPRTMCACRCLKSLPPDRWIKALNALLPSAIRVLRCRYVSQDFHARLSAKGKIYRYRIWNASVLPPFEYRRAWHVAQPLDLKILKSAAKYFVGTHDFAASPPIAASLNGLRSAQLIPCASKKGPCVTIEFDGDGFLYKMVRLMVGALGNARLAKCMSRNHFATELGQNRSARFVAPAEGFFSSMCVTRAPCRYCQL